ncbi:hypothetical protein [Coprococcus sp. HCN-4056]|jgi:hypothetical protein|uniref:hypothetical protein n=1 Tax=Coprococcus sp. HCN-4056 TaxID=3134671 RepID=UPI0030BC0C38
MEYIEIDKKIFLQVFEYEDIEAFTQVCERSQEANYFAIKEIWNQGIKVILIYKRFLGIISNNIGFISMIDCGQLSNKEKRMLSLFGVPKKYSGIFINDMRMSVPQRHKGIGTKVVNKILSSDETYMLEPVEDGKSFWMKFGFKENGKLSIREKVE